MPIVVENRDLENICKKYNLSNIIIFESIRTDVFCKEFDIDIAVIGEKKLRPEDTLQVKMYFEQKFGKTIDIIDLKNEHLDIFLKTRILNTGKSIYTNDDNKSFKDFTGAIEWYHRKTENKFKEIFSMTLEDSMLLENSIEKRIKAGIEKEKEIVKAEMLAQQLASKFKNITREDIQTIKKLSTVKVFVISIKIFDIASLEELRTYF